MNVSPQQDPGGKWNNLFIDPKANCAVILFNIIALCVIYTLKKVLCIVDLMIAGKFHTHVDKLSGLSSSGRNFNDFMLLCSLLSKPLMFLNCTAIVVNYTVISDELIKQTRKQSS